MRKSMGAMTIMQYFVGSRLEYVRRVPARAEEHERHARHSDEEEQSDGHAEDALYLIQPAFARASEIIIDTATGSPAVEIM